MKSVIFDLDLTLVDASIADHARKNRDWQLVYSLIPSFKLYDGLSVVFDYIRNHGIKVCIVATAPRSYVERVIRCFAIPCNYIVAYHDAKPIKPHPAPMCKALELLEEHSFNVISFGDRTIDIISSRCANIKSAACLWGTKESRELRECSPDIILNSPSDILEYLG